MVKRASIEIKGVIEKPEKKEKRSGGKSGRVFCKKCGAVYCKKSWRHAAGRNTAGIKASPKAVLCPACLMIKNRQFEGEITLENFPSRLYNELLNLVNSFCRRAYEIDPLDRLIKIEKNKQGLKITTTENQLAVKLAKKIKQVFSRVEMKISHSPSPEDTAYVKLVFKK